VAGGLTISLAVSFAVAPSGWDDFTETVPVSVPARLIRS
jgi:hypothetical protein